MNELNDNGIFLLDVFVLNYYGILVFFQVCKTTEETVFLVELGTKRYKNGIMLTKHFKAAKKPLIILNNNTHTRSTYEVVPYKMTVPIKITFDSPLYKEALKRTELPTIGTFYAEKVFEYANKYWIVEENEKEKCYSA